MLHSSIVANTTRMIQGIDTGALAPLSPRSIVLSVLLGSHPPQMPVGHILEFTSLFDLADGTVRTALSRMVTAGELVNDDGTYRLVGRLVERQVQQDVGRNHPPAAWDRDWWTVAVLPERRTMLGRRAFRAWAIGARLGELRPDLWLRPANIDIPLDPPDALVTRGPLITGDERHLVSQLWDLHDLEHRSAGHLCGLDDAAFRLDDPDNHSLADAFVALAGAQQFLRIEPQLPAQLTSDASIRAVRDLYGQVVDKFQARLTDFFAERSADRISTTAQ